MVGCALLGNSSNISQNSEERVFRESMPCTFMMLVVKTLGGVRWKSLVVQYGGRVKVHCTSVVTSRDVEDERGGGDIRRMD